MVYLDNLLSEIKGIGPKFLTRLEKLKIKTVGDLLRHFPSRYEDFSNFVAIKDLKIGQHATVRGEIKSVKLRRTWKKKMFILETIIEDKTGSIRAVWFNQKFLITMLKKGKTLNLAGKVSESKEGGLMMSHPVFEIMTMSKTDEDLRHTGRVIPVYPETKGLTSKGFRYLIQPILKKLEISEDLLPEETIKKYELLDLKTALKLAHFPDKISDAQKARRRFAFEDLTLIHLVNLRHKIKLSREKAHSVEYDLDLVKKWLSEIPFELTHSQKKSLWEILKDLEKFHPMNRLLQGDVGSGKTIVAVLAALAAVQNSGSGGELKRQAAFMAPTEILTRQHYDTFKKHFSDFEGGVGIITSSSVAVFYGDGLESKIKKADMIEKIGRGEIKIVFGTHSLIQKYVRFAGLVLLVVDEQHRFGVKQRAELLKNKEQEIPKESKSSAGQARNKNLIPHFLSMSATPIPRTLSLTVYGDLDLSIIDELPKGRKEIITKIVAPENRGKAYAFIRGQIKKGRQAFVICPRIESAEESESGEENVKIDWRKLVWLDVKAVKEEYEKLSKEIFPDLKVEMLHGKLKAVEKNSIMEKFKNGEIDILVSTSVIEVGVDVPNATIMMIESAERFGLAQLYQFRGRVGRGERQSFCFLFTELKSKFVFSRLRSLIEAKNGFELAEKDLALRGPGEFLGESQAGLPDLAMRALQNPNLVKEAREAAVEIITADPELKSRVLLKERLDGFQKEIHLE